MCEQHNEVSAKLGKPEFPCTLEALDDRWRISTRRICNPFKYHDFEDKEEEGMGGNSVQTALGDEGKNNNRTTAASAVAAAKAEVVSEDEDSVIEAFIRDMENE